MTHPTPVIYESPEYRIPMNDKVSNLRRHRRLWIAFCLGLALLGSAWAEPASGLSRTLTVDDTHLLVPVGNTPERMKEAKIRIGIHADGRKVQDFRVRLPAEGDPGWWAAYPLEGLGIRDGEISLKVEDTGTIEHDFEAAFRRIRVGPASALDEFDLFREPYRNQFHVSARRGWNNDPNGMVFHDGVYHLYHQFNPFGIFWGNMHWGHYTSRDLIHWEEQPIALFQKTVDDMAYSGGGFVDFNDSAGLGEDTLFVAFTSTGSGECLAYSHDGGITCTELPENPVVRHDGRDPKVIWFEPERKWVMAVYNAEDGPELRAVPRAEGKDNRKRRFANIAFYESRNLRQWTRTGAFTDPDRTAVFECPELFELPVEGRPGESRWILYGAQNRYFIGHFNGDVFRKESGPHGEGPGAFYAAQTFSDTPDGRRIQVGWVRTDSYVERFPHQRVNQALSLPHTMTLHDTPDGLRLHYQPVRETRLLRKDVLGWGSDLTAEEANALLQACRGELTEVRITFKNAGEHSLTINGMDAGFTGRTARVFTDRTFNEVYVDGGREYWVRTLPAGEFDARATDIASGAVETLEIHRLKSIWKGE